MTAQTNNPDVPGPVITETPPAIDAPTDDYDGHSDSTGYDPAAAQAAVEAQMAQLRQNAAQAVDALGEDDGADPEPDAEPEVPADDAEPGDGDTEPEPQPVDDSTVAALKREKALRDERTALQQERAEFERERALFKLQLQADPIGFLKANGVDISAPLAEEFVNETLGELAPDTHRQTQEARRLARENAEYKARLEAYQKQSLESEYQQYANNLNAAINGVSAEKYPAFARVSEVYGPESASAMAWQVAQQYAQAGIVATPDQILGHLDQQYAPLVGARPDVQPPVQQTAPPKPKRGRTRSLRNNMQQSGVPPKPIEEMTPEEQERVWRANATKAYNEAVAKGQF